MASFFKSFFACLLAIVVSGFIGFMLLIGVAGAFTALLSSKTVAVPSGSVLKITLAEPIQDNPQINIFKSFNPSTMSVSRPLALLDVLNAIEIAKNDPNISGVYLELSPMMSVGTATLEEIRNALIDFRSSGKFIVSYNDTYTQATYYLSSVADRIYLNPAGGLAWQGMAAQALFFKGTLDKLGVEPEIIRHGKYKSAIEPYTSDRMSPENREQTESLVHAVWDNVVAGVSEVRGIAPAALQQYASQLEVTSPEQALEAGMIDAIAYKDEVSDYIESMVADYNAVSLVDYTYNRGSSADMKGGSKNGVAVIYAEGNIVDGDNGDGVIASARLSRQLRSARENDDIKAVVLRVNSPGGSALAAEVIWREAQLLQQEKPLVVSMGDYAASGGYYISVPADAILASPSTITGSIGVFGVLFNAEKGLSDKLGITSDVARTNPAADMGTFLRPLSPMERANLEASVERTYTMFVSHVAEGRNMTVPAVDDIAQGRVWSGVQASQNGLIDGFGGIKDAIALAADRAGVAAGFQVVPVLDEVSSIGQLFGAMVEAKEGWLGGNRLEEPLYRNYRHIMNVLEGAPIQAVLPYTLIFY